MRLFFLIILCVLSLQITHACEIRDDVGQLIRLKHPAERIISLAPDLTEILFAIGAEKQVIGVVRGSDYPLAAKKLPVVASYNSVDIESIMALHPDLIVAWSDENFVGQLSALDVPIYLSHPHKLTDVASTMQRLGCLVGRGPKAHEQANLFLQQYHGLQKKYATKKNISVFYQLWPKPLITVTKKSWINEVITLCGGKNIFADVQGIAPEINIEAVIVKNPDVIIGSDGHLAWKKMWQAWPKINAVKNQNLFSINPDLIERAGPRIVIGAEKMCELIRRADVKN